MSRTIHQQLFLPHAPELVWDYLTNSGLMAQWLMENDFKPIIGYDFQFKTKPLPNFNFDGLVYCKVLEVVPFERLSYSWKGGPGNGSITLDSVVVWELHPKDNGTELLLQHSGFPENEQFSMMHSIMQEGWLRIIQKIAECLNTAKHGASNT